MLDPKRRRSLQIHIERHSLSSGKKTTIKLAEDRGAQAADAVFQIVQLDGEPSTDRPEGVGLFAMSADGKTGKELDFKALYRMWVFFTLHLLKLAPMSAEKKFLTTVITHLGLTNDKGPGEESRGPVILSSIGKFEPVSPPDAASDSSELRASPR